MMSSQSVSRYLLRLAPALLIAAAATCGPIRRGTGPSPAVLLFTNESLYQADVFVVAQGLGATRIGTVMGGQTDTLVVPASLTRGGTMSIVARLFARSALARSGPVAILAGERYEVRLPPDARLLSFLPARQ